MAAESGLTAIVEMFLSLPGIEVNARTDVSFLDARRSPCIIFTDRMSNHCCSLHRCFQRGETALVLAAQEGHTATVNVLISHPTIDVNLYSTVSLRTIILFFVHFP